MCYQQKSIINIFHQINQISEIITTMDCYYHPKQPLTNFCNNPLCSLPLCPKCISVHLNQSTIQHEMMPLGQILAAMTEQLQTSQQALQQQLKSLREQYDPKNILKDYKGMLDKYRLEALDQINRHYDYLERQLLNQIGSRYSYHLQNIAIPLEAQLKNIQTWTKNIKKNDKCLETLIQACSQQAILNVENLLLKIKDKKVVFKSELPRLQDGQGGKLRMTSQRIDVYSLKESPRIKNISANAQALSGLDRIADLQARLLSLRYD